MRSQAITLAAVTFACLFESTTRSGAGATAPAPVPVATAPALKADGVRKIDTQLVLDQADAQKTALDFINSSKAHADAVLNLDQCKGCHQDLRGRWKVENPEQLHIAVGLPDEPWVGVSVGPADEVLRSQLKLPEGTGVVVTKVLPDGPAQKADVREHDIVLSVNGQPVPDGDALDVIVKAAKSDAPPLTIKLLRDGQPAERQVTPSREPRQWLSVLSNVVNARSPYRIGVSVSEPDGTLRKQLRLDGVGLVVTEVAADSPAARQGVKVNDVLLSANGRAMKEGGDLPDVVRGAAESPVELELLRGGVRLKVTVTPVKDESAAVNEFLTTQLAETYANKQLMLVQPGLIKYPGIDLSQVGDPNAKSQAQRDGSSVERLDQIADQLEKLRAAVQSLREEVARQAPPAPAGK